MVMKTSLHVLAAGLVLDRSIFANSPAPAMSECIMAIRAAGNKPLYVVDSAEDFFSMKNLFDLIQKKDKTMTLVNEGLGNFLAQDQINALLGVNAAIAPAAAIQHVHDEPAIPYAEQAQHAKDQAGDVIVNFDQKPYKFAEVPAGWSVGSHMSLGPTKIKRHVKNSDGDGTMFYMSPDSYKTLWEYASRVWSGEDLPHLKINTSVGHKMAMINGDKISLGGNYIRRYELEQVAKYRGWALPNNVAIAA